MTANGFARGYCTTCVHYRPPPSKIPDVPIRADLLLFLRPTPRAHRRAAADAEGKDTPQSPAGQSMAQASDRRRALADRAGDMQFCADDFIWPTTGNDHAHWLDDRRPRPP